MDLAPRATPARLGPASCLGRAVRDARGGFSAVGKGLAWVSGRRAHCQRCGVLESGPLLWFLHRGCCSQRTRTPSLRCGVLLAAIRGCVGGGRGRHRRCCVIGRCVVCRGGRRLRRRWAGTKTEAKAARRCTGRLGRCTRCIAAWSSAEAPAATRRLHRPTKTTECCHAPPTRCYQGAVTPANKQATCVAVEMLTTRHGTS